MDHARAVNRRQFLASGGAAAMALGLYGAMPASARAALLVRTPVARLGRSDLAVLAGLTGAICAANDRPDADAAALGLLTPAEFADAYASCDPGTRAAISAVLAVIEQGPDGDVFSGLGALGQTTFVSGAFASLEVYVPSAAQLTALDALGASTNALVASLATGRPLAEIASDLPSVAAPTPRALNGAPGEDYVFTQTLLCGLALVSEPLVENGPPAERPALSAATVRALRAWLADGAEGAAHARHPSPELTRAVHRELARPLVVGVDPRVYPCAALSRALTVWLSARRS